MTDRDDLIEEAAKAIYEHSETTDDGVTCMGCDERIDNDLAKHQARIALAVFEKASAPTDREHPNLIDAAADAFEKRGGAPTWQDDPSGRDAALRWHMRGFEDGLAAGFRRPSPPESTTEQDERIDAWHYVADHEAFKACYDEEQPLIDSVLARITQLHEMESTVNELAPAPTLPLEPSDALTIPRPHVPYGPVGIPECEADADYLDHAASNLEGRYEVGGSNVRATVIKLLRDTASALRAAVVTDQGENR